MKPGSNFKMSRAVKTMLAFSGHKVGLRQALIQGELYSRVVIKSKRATEANDKS